MHFTLLPALSALFILAILDNNNLVVLAENDASNKFFEVVFLDYVHEYNEVYANVDIAEEADYRGFLCGSPACQDEYELFAGNSPHFRKYQIARILLTNDENLFQQISQEGVKFCLTKLHPENEGMEEAKGKTLCYIRYKGKGKSGSSYQIYHGAEEEENEERKKQKEDEQGSDEGFFSAEKEEENLGGESSEEIGATNDPLVDLNKGYKKAKASLDKLNPEDTNGKAAKQRLEAMLDAVLEVISAKTSGFKMTRSEAKRKLLRIAVDKVSSAYRILGQDDQQDLEALKQVHTFDQRFGTEAREYINSEYLSKQQK